MTRHDLRNAIALLHNLDAHELVSAGVIDHADGKAWQTFASNPERFFLRCTDERKGHFFRHETREVAEQEAQRLAMQFPGSRFVVLEAVAAYCVSEAGAQP